METWKLFKIRIKLVLEKIQLNFLSWLEIIYLALSIIFGVLTLVKPGPEHSFFFFQASVENLYCSPQLGASGSCYILTLETFILSELLDILHARFVSIIEIILLLSENFLILLKYASWLKL